MDFPLPDNGFSFMDFPLPGNGFLLPDNPYFYSSNE